MLVSHLSRFHIGFRSASTFLRPIGRTWLAAWVMMSKFEEPAAYSARRFWVKLPESGSISRSTVTLVALLASANCARQALSWSPPFVLTNTTCLGGALGLAPVGAPGPA